MLIAAVVLLIWNGSSFFRELALRRDEFGPGVRWRSTALTLNVALILFGWRRYVDLQHEAEHRIEALTASGDPRLDRPGHRPAQPQGLCRRAGQLCRRPDRAITSSSSAFQAAPLQVSLRPARLRDRRPACSRASGALAEDAGQDAVVARLGGDEFAIATRLARTTGPRRSRSPTPCSNSMTRPLLFDEKMIQVGAFAGMASAPADRAIPDLLRRADIALDHARIGRVARPIWFDAGMERALIAHGEIEQGIRFGLEHGHSCRSSNRRWTCDGRDHWLRGAGALEASAFWGHRSRRFIPVAEEIGLIGRLSRAGDRGSAARGAGLGPVIKISVNISPSQFADGWLARAHRPVR